MDDGQSKELLGTLKAISKELSDLGEGQKKAVHSSTRYTVFSKILDQMEELNSNISSLEKTIGAGLESIAAELEKANKLAQAAKKS